MGSPVIVFEYAPEDSEADASMAPPTTITMGVTDRLLLEYERWRAMFDVLIESAKVLASNEKSNKRGTPPTPEPVLFGIRALAHLWTQYLGKPISTSELDGKFGAFTLEFFRLLPNPRPFVSEVRTGLRKFVAERQASQP